MHDIGASVLGLGSRWAFGTPEDCGSAGHTTLGCPTTPGGFFSFSLGGAAPWGPMPPPWEDGVGSRPSSWKSQVTQVTQCAQLAAERL